MSERRTACDTLIRVENGGYSNLLLAAVPTEKLTPFVTAVVYGTLERKITIDELLTPLIKGGLNRLDIEVASVLRMSAYQLLYMDSVPEYAAINEGVKLCRTYKKSSATGLVNAVLRKVKTAKMPTTDTATYSLHPDILKLLKADYPDCYRDIAKATLQRPQCCIYTNVTKITVQELTKLLAKQGVICRAGVAKNTLLCEGEPPVKTDAFKNGLFHIVSTNSAIIAQGLVAHSPKRVLDLCAAPGGKTAIMAMGAEHVVAADLKENRLSAMKKQLARLGISNVEYLQNDASISAVAGSFDAVLCDVPCSGTGVISHKPELRNRPPRIKELLEVQEKILNNAADCVATGGILCYSTCSLSRDENERRVEQFLKQNTDFKPVELPFDAPDFCENSVGRLTFFPDNKIFDGFFVAFLQKV